MGEIIFSGRPSIQVRRCAALLVQAHHADGCSPQPTIALSGPLNTHTITLLLEHSLVFQLQQKVLNLSMCSLQLLRIPVGRVLQQLLLVVYMFLRPLQMLFQIM